MADPGGCWECKQKNGHAETGGVHKPWHCKPDRCPDRDKHAERVYGDRFQSRLTGAGRDGVTTTAYIDGKKASSAYVQIRCICGLLLIWTPKETAASASVPTSSPPGSPPFRPDPELIRNAEGDERARKRTVAAANAANDTAAASIVVCGPPKGCTCPAVAWSCVCEASERGRRLITERRQSREQVTDTDSPGGQ